jgi:ligand-binding sensor domain-containing protein
VGQIAGLPSSRVLALSADTGNKVWVGTTEGLAWVSLNDYRSRIYPNPDR